MSDHDHTRNPQQALWQAVLLQQVEDALLGVDAPGARGRNPDEVRQRRIAATKRARAYLTKANEDLAIICTLAGLDPQAVLDAMRKRIANAPTPEELASKPKAIFATPKAPAKPKPARQKRETVFTLDGETLHISEWAKRVNVSPVTIRHRIYERGWSIRDALTKPAQESRRNAIKSAALRKAAQKLQKPKRSIATLTHNGLTLTFTQWAERTGIPMRTIRTRHVAGWPVERILDANGQRRKAKAEGAAE